MKKSTGVSALVLVCAALPAMGQAPTGGSEECAALRSLQLPGVALSEISAEWIPASVVAARRGEPRMTRPLCPYPRYARYSGRGDQNDAASFACQAP